MRRSMAVRRHNNRRTNVRAPHSGGGGGSGSSSSSRGDVLCGIEMTTVEWCHLLSNLR